MVFKRSKDEDVIPEHIDCFKVSSKSYRGDSDVLNMTSTHKTLLNKSRSFLWADTAHISLHERVVNDLLIWNLIRPVFSNYGKNEQVLKGYSITPYGMSINILVKKYSKKNRGNHDKLIYALAKDKEKNDLIAFCDMQFGSSYGSSRPDLFTIRPTLNEENMSPCAYEIKISRSDFLSDMKKPEKWKSYLEIAEMLYYVCPAGLISKDEVPKECGLMYYDEKNDSFDIVKRGKRFKKTMSVNNLMRLFLRERSENNSILVSSRGKENEI